VDDDAFSRAVVSRKVAKFSDVVEAEDGLEALARLQSMVFDLAIVDIFLGGTNGVDVIRTLRERSPNLPIVAISGVTALDFLSASPELSNVVCLQKPFRPTELLRAIQAATRFRVGRVVGQGAQMSYPSDAPSRTLARHTQCTGPDPVRNLCSRPVVLALNLKLDLNVCRRNGV